MHFHYYNRSKFHNYCESPQSYFGLITHHTFHSKNRQQKVGNYTKSQKLPDLKSWTHFPLIQLMTFSTRLAFAMTCKHKKIFSQKHDLFPAIKHHQTIHTSTSQLLTFPATWQVRTASTAPHQARMSSSMWFQITMMKSRHSNKRSYNKLQQSSSKQQIFSKNKQRLTSGKPKSQSRRKSCAPSVKAHTVQRQVSEAILIKNILAKRMVKNNFLAPTVINSLANPTSKGISKDANQELRNKTKTE